ncbi:MAG: TonB-dependent receptor [Bacteroidota bacterium]
MKIILLSIFWLTCLVATAQSSFQVVDGKTGEPLVGATAVVSDASGATEQLISDLDGFFSSNLSFPLEAEIRYVGFETLSMVVNSQTQVVSLENSSNFLNEVVVTGQLRPQSIDQSVYTIQAIDNRRIQDQAGVDVADILSNNLNLTLVPNKGDGTTEIEMLGLDGNYTKVLIDGVPFVGVDGNGNNADLTQIILSDIERIEIVEGPMSVTYGSNAIAGVINIITKRTPSNQIFIQEETVGNEYGVDQGRHIQSISLGTNIGKRFVVKGNLIRNDFRGFFNGYQGFDHIKRDSLRGHDWLPKKMINGNLALSFNSKSLYARYRYDRFSQRLDRFNREPRRDEHPQSGLVSHFALDNEFETVRDFHNLTLEGQLRGLRFNMVNSYSSVTREERIVRNRIETKATEELTFASQRFMKSALSRGTVSEFFDSDKVNIELGYEYTWAGMRDPSTNRVEEDPDIEFTGDLGRAEQTLTNVAGFSNAEFQILPNLTLRSGIRFIYNDLYNSTPLVWENHIKWQLPSEYNFRVSVGRGYRTPSLTELYDKFIDANHFFIGNPELDPEDGKNINLSLAKNYQLGNGRLNATFNAFFNRIRDRITQVEFAEDKFSLFNVTLNETKGFTLRGQFQNGKVTSNFGISYIGRYNTLRNGSEQYDERFFYTPEANANLTYQIAKPNIRLSTFYKYTGRREQYAWKGGEYVLGARDSFGWMDFNTAWSHRNWLTIQLGVRNIFNLTDVQSTAESGGAHANASTSVGLTYGRSYFLKTVFDF